jgi:hypothetical protein
MQQQEISKDEHFRTMPVRSDYLLRSQVYRSPQRLGSIGHPQDLSFLDRPWYYEEADNTWGGRNAEIEKWERSYESDDTLDYESENTLVGGGEVEEKDSLELFVNPAKKYSVSYPFEPGKAPTNKFLSYTS